MKRPMILLSAILLIITLIFSLLYLRTDTDIFETLAITFGTTAYHFVMRLLVGFSIDSVMKNRADLTKKRYQPRKWEDKLYKLLNVKKWKGIIPMFVPEYFDLRKKTPYEAAMAMCQAETVHEIILVLNFLPIFAARWFGALPVFVITSLIASLMEIACIIAQRYNRPRLIRMMERKSRKNSEIKR